MNGHADLLSLSNELNLMNDQRGRLESTLPRYIR